MVDASVVAVVRNYLRALDAEGIPVRFGVIFGSQATGRVDRWSDIDLLVVSPRFDLTRTREDVNVLWRTAARVDSRIEPVPVGERQWIEDDSLALLEIGRREGEKVTIPE